MLDWVRWPDTSDRLLLMAPDDTCWRPGNEFEVLYYERSLKLLFAELFQSALHLAKYVKAGKRPHRLIYGWFESYKAGNFISVHRTWFITADQTLEWFWPKVDPLDELAQFETCLTSEICVRPKRWGLPIETEKRLGAMCSGSDIEITKDDILHMGMMFHGEPLPTDPRKQTWAILEIPECNVRMPLFY
ncbi:hypothetical protein DYI41_16605 [Marinobacter salarius]|nr:hypothetical protein [Marinobacter salarius]